MKRHAVTLVSLRDMSRCHAHVTESRPVPSRPVPKTSWYSQVQSVTQLTRTRVTGWA